MLRDKKDSTSRERPKKEKELRERELRERRRTLKEKPKSEL